MVFEPDAVAGDQADTAMDSDPQDDRRADELSATDQSESLEPELMADCVPLTCGQLQAQCGEISNSCGDDINCGDCLEFGCKNQCMSNQCVPNFHDHKACHDNDVYWFDSCEQPVELDADCQNGCENNLCKSCSPQCQGKECGPDQCGQECPPGCAPGTEVCLTDGTCCAPIWEDATSCNCTPGACVGCSGTKQQADGCGNTQTVSCNLPASGCSTICCQNTCCPANQICHPIIGDCRPSDFEIPVQGTFMNLLDYEEDLPGDRMAQFMEELKQLGMNVVILNFIQSKTAATGCAGSEFIWNLNCPGKLQVIFDEARLRNINVYVGLVRTANACSESQEDPDNTTTLNAYLTNYSNPLNPIMYVLDNFGSYSNFAGWFISDEPQFTWREPPNSPTSIQFFHSYVQAIKAKSSKPVLAAPGMVGINTRTPQDIANRAKYFMDNTGVDIFTWQDSVGEVAANIGWRSDQQTTQVYYQAIANAIGKTHLWADLEFGNCCVYPTYDWRAGLTKPAALGRIKKQIELSKGVVDKIVIWIEQHQLGTVSTVRYPGSHRLRGAYQSYFGFSGEYLLPISYTWETPPHASYPDDQHTKLFDLETGYPGDPFNVNYFLPTGWVGVVGNVSLVFNLGSVKTVDWVGVHLLQHGPSAIYFPKELSVFCSTDGNQWTEKGRWPLPLLVSFSKVEDIPNGEYVFSNPNDSPLQMSCSQVKLQLSQAVSWYFTFVSEVELVSETSL